MGLCILASGSVVKVYAAVAAFSLVWTHSVEKIEWREDWRVDRDHLALVEAHVHGIGAGMEPPADARRDETGWTWTPHVEPLPSVTLRRSGVVADWRLCVDGGCAVLATMVPADADPVLLKACNAPDESLARAPVYDAAVHAGSEGGTRAR
ncbi:MAG: DUF1850 domain-containing protein [Gemmatimonas sp.]